METRTKASANFIKRIALIGPESTGKTTLCKQLARFFGTVWVPEYERYYMRRRMQHYNLVDIEHCAKKQIEWETRLLARAKGYFFADTELIILKVWCEWTFKTCPVWLDETIDQYRYDLYLLTYPDIPFQPDPIRSCSDHRSTLFKHYQMELEKRQFSFFIVKGLGTARLASALNAIFSKNHKALAKQSV